MQRRAWMSAVGVLIAVTGLAAQARGATVPAHLEFIDTGTPVNNETGLSMPGWRGVLVRVATDDGSPFTSMSVRSIGGCIAQRWTDSTGQGNYTETSPGPSFADNSFDSDENFDSHFLYLVGLLSTPATRSEGIHSVGLYTGRVPIPSDGYLGYGATTPEPYWDPFGAGSGGWMDAEYQFNPAAPRSSIDLAYVVTESRFSVLLSFYSGSGSGGTGATFYVPEPGSLLLITTFIAFLWHRPKRRRIAPFALVETLEQRQMLTVSAPTDFVGIG